MGSLTELPGSRNGGQGAEVTEALDTALENMQAGMPVEAALRRVPPEMKNSIYSLLRIAQQVKQIRHPTPDPEKKAEGLSNLLDLNQ